MDDLLRGVVNVIPSAVVTQAIAAAGADFVLIDLEHGPIGPENLHAMVASTARSDCAPLVRVSAIDEAEVKRALDGGAEGSSSRSSVRRTTRRGASRSRPIRLRDPVDEGRSSPTRTGGRRSAVTQQRSART